MSFYFFFFSSRRRHTRLTCDWSSDVCSSDLGGLMDTTVTSTPGEQRTSSGVYVYCIIEASEPRTFGKIGIGGRGDDVYTIHYRDLAAVVSQAALQVYD